MSLILITRSLALCITSISDAETGTCARARTGDCVQRVPTTVWGLLRPTGRRRPSPQDSHNPSRACTRTCFNPEEELLSRIERYEGAVYWLQPKCGTVDQQEACICVNEIKTRYQTIYAEYSKVILCSQDDDDSEIERHQKV
jgi:hypothetical protein